MKIAAAGSVIGTLMMLAGCSPPSADAEREVSIMENAHATGDELCRAKRKLADAYLHEKNVDKYKVARLSAYAECALAEQ